VGELRVPGQVLYGIQTLRASHNCRISTLRVHPNLLTAYAEVKKAAALTNVELGKLGLDIGRAIVSSADEVIGAGGVTNLIWTYSRPAPALPISGLHAVRVVSGVLGSYFLRAYRRDCCDYDP
jgi:hypothetical protein